jgi:hypothetical protein
VAVLSSLLLVAGLALPANAQTDDIDRLRALARAATEHRRGVEADLNDHLRDIAGSQPGSTARRLAELAYNEAREELDDAFDQELEAVDRYRKAVADAQQANLDKFDELIGDGQWLSEAEQAQVGTERERLEGMVDSARRLRDEAREDLEAERDDVHDDLDQRHGEAGGDPDAFLYADQLQGAAADQLKGNPDPSEDDLLDVLLGLVGDDDPFGLGAMIKSLRDGLSPDQPAAGVDRPVAPVWQAEVAVDQAEQDLAKAEAAIDASLTEREEIAAMGRRDQAQAALAGARDQLDKAKADQAKADQGAAEQGKEGASGDQGEEADQGDQGAEQADSAKEAGAGDEQGASPPENQAFLDGLGAEEPDGAGGEGAVEGAVAPLLAPVIGTPAVRPGDQAPGQGAGDEAPAGDQADQATVGAATGLAAKAASAFDAGAGQPVPPGGCQPGGGAEVAATCEPDGDSGPKILVNTPPPTTQPTAPGPGIMPCPPGLKAYADGLGCGPPDDTGGDAPAPEPEPEMVPGCPGGPKVPKGTMVTCPSLEDLIPDLVTAGDTGGSDPLAVLTAPKVPSLGGFGLGGTGQVVSLPFAPVPSAAGLDACAGGMAC